MVREHGPDGSSQLGEPLRRIGDDELWRAALPALAGGG